MAADLTQDAPRPAPTDDRQRLRLDKAMLARGLVPSRARAQDLIRRGLVTVDGEIATQPARLVAAAQHVIVAATHRDAGHVSRGSEKLAPALRHFDFCARGAAALDVGASTGGFTRVLLDQGAARVYAVDVGHDQMHATLRADPRVTVLEGCDARTLTRGLIPEPVTGITADVSFISLTKVLPAVVALAAPRAWLVALIKPQFEAGREAIGRGGIVREQAARDAAVETVRRFVAQLEGWTVRGVIPSPISGGSGNVEYLIGAQRHGG